MARAITNVGDRLEFEGRQLTGIKPPTPTKWRFWQSGVHRPHIEVGDVEKCGFFRYTKIVLVDLGDATT